MKTVSVVGGDLRQITLCKLLKKDGFSVSAYGLGEIPDSGMEAVFSADFIIFPMPVCGGCGKELNAPFAQKTIDTEALIEKISPESVVLGGKIPPWMCDFLAHKKIRYIDYLKREDLAVKNAVPTSEGAIEIAMNELPVTLHQSRCLVIGYGRIGRVLARMLQGLGAYVSVAARRSETLAWIDSEGCTPVKTADMSDTIHTFDVIFNTAPALVLDRAMLRRIPKESVVIDLASKPGGVDFDAAKETGVKVIWALSLPGKVAPLTAGAILKDTVVNIIDETEEPS